MMEDHQTIISPDASRNGNEGCPSPRDSAQEQPSPLHSIEEHHDVPQAHPVYYQATTQEHQEISQAHPLHSMEEHHEIPQAHILYSRDSTQEPHEIPQEPHEMPQAHLLYSQDSTQDHQEIPQSSLLYSWDSSQEGGSDYRKHLNIVMVESHFEEGAHVDTGQGEPGGNALWTESGHSKEDHVEGGVPQGQNTYGRSEAEEDDVVVIEEEEDATSLIPVDQKTSQRYGTADGDTHLSDWRPDDVSRWSTQSGVGPDSPTLNHQTMGSSRPFSCGDCSASFKHKSSLLLHQSIHAGKKPYSCSECGKQFAQKANYLRHQRLHMGEKQYKCTECAQKQCLVLQQKLYAEVGPFSCSACGANFIREPHSVNQKKTQKGMRHFTCPDCGDVFMLRSSLVIHQKVHSAENGNRPTFKENAV